MMTPEEYEAAFHGIELPSTPIQLVQGTTIPDVRVFLDKELTILKHNGSDRVKDAVRWRLNKLLQIINENSVN